MLERARTYVFARLCCNAGEPCGDKSDIPHLGGEAAVFPAALPAL
jgi:hypothetical protein